MKKIASLGPCLFAVSLASQALATPVAFPDRIYPTAHAITFDHPEIHRVAQTIIKSGLRYGVAPIVLPEGKYHLIELLAPFELASAANGDAFVLQNDWPQMAGEGPDIVRRLGLQLGGSGVSWVPDTSGASVADSGGVLPASPDMFGLAISEPARAVVPTAQATKSPLPVVPAPAGVVLMISALGSLGIAARRKQRRG